MFAWTSVQAILRYGDVFQEREIVPYIVDFVHTLIKIMSIKVNDFGDHIRGEKMTYAKQILKMAYSNMVL